MRVSLFVMQSVLHGISTRINLNMHMWLQHGHSWFSQILGPIAWNSWVLSFDNDDLQKLIDVVMSWLHYLPSSNKTVINKVEMISWTFSGKNLGILLAKQVLTVIVQFTLKMMLFPESLIFGMKWIHSHSLKFLGFLPATYHQSTSV